MKISYKKLWKLLIDRDMSKNESGEHRERRSALFLLYKGYAVPLS